MDLLRRIVSLEGVASLCGIASVWYSKNRSVLVFPTGILATAISIALCIQHGIYGDTAILCFFLLMSLYGWYRWSHGSLEGDRVIVGSSSIRFLCGSLILSLALWAIVYQILIRFTNSTVPVLDSFVTGFSIVGMLLMAEKKLENWLYWIAVNSVSVALFWSKGLPLIAIKYCVYCAFAVWGYTTWRRLAAPATIRSDTKCQVTLELI